MKVSLRASALFYLPVSLKLVRQLMQLSKRHYDGECQRASARVGQPLYPGSVTNWPVNGVLTQWLDRFEPNAAESDETEVRSTWSELDLIAKICEGVQFESISEFRRVHDFRIQILRAMTTAGPVVTNLWKLDFEV